MTSVRKIIPAVLAMSVLAGACGLIPGIDGPGETAEEFYACQTRGAAPPPVKMFVDEEAAREASLMLAERDTMYGTYVSHRKIGSNRKISVEAGGREETITFMFEVDCENGRTRETLMIRRGRATDAFRIASYTIEDVPRSTEPLPMGTGSA